MADLYESIKRSTRWLERFDRPGERVGEQNTKAAVIEPILAALGWELYDLDEVQREYRRRPTDNPVDYALLLLRKPRLFVEAKGVGEHLDDPRWANQTISYATAAGVEWVALTNGGEWRIYNAHAPVPIEEKLFQSVRLRGDPDMAFEVLSLLSKEGMRENRIEELWRSFFVDRQVHSVLADLFNTADPARELINLVAKRIANLRRPEIRDSLARVRISFDFPSPGTPDGQPPEAPSLPTPTTQAGQGRSAAAHKAWETRRRRAGVATGARVSGSKRVSAEERRVSLIDVIASGRLRAGDTIRTNYRGSGQTAEVRPDGTIRYRGRAYGSPSTAGEAVKIELLGQDVPATVRATDGWGFWRAVDARAGDEVTLKELRSRTAGVH